MPQETDILDSMLAIAIILFIVSMIVEKITQLIRRYSPFIKPSLTEKAGWFATVWRNVRYRQSTSNTELDKKIEREVASLSFIVGSLIALAFRIDLFKMISVQDPRTVLFWNPEVDYNGIEIFLLFISIPLTGFFLSFGSKFFHDLIDTLLQVKNLKRKLVDDETFKVDSVQQLDEFLDKTNTDIVRSAIEQNRNLLQAADAVSPPMHGRIKKDGKLIDCIDIHLAGNSRGLLPQVVQAKLGSGKTVNVIVNAIYDVDEPIAQVLQGDTNANMQSPDFQGTICCKIDIDGAEYLLTCSHVLTGGSPKNYFGSIQPTPANIDNQPDGAYTWATCTNEFDMALLKPDSTNFSYLINLNKERRPTPSDILTTNVKVVCRNQQIKTGTVVNDCAIDPIALKYAGGNKHALTNLIIISNVTRHQDSVTYTGITIPGDSGACVLDDNERPIGMIVAGNSKFSYAIPLVSILNRLTATIIK